MSARQTYVQNTNEKHTKEKSDDFAKVNRFVTEVINVIRSENFSPYFDLFTEDAKWMMPNSFRDVSVEEARKFYRFTDKFRFDQQTNVDEIVVSGDWAFVRIGFDGYLRAKADPSAAPLRSVSRHIWILRKQKNNDWKIYRDIWNNPKIQ